MFNQAPLLQLILPFIAGILAYIYLPNNSFPLYFSVIASILVLILHLIKQFNDFKFQWIHKITIALCFFIVGNGITKVSDEKNNKLHFSNYLSDKKQTSFIEIIEEPIEKEKTIKIIGNIISIDNNNSTGKALIYLQKDNRAQNLNFRDIISINQSFKSIEGPKNEEEFNYKLYLAFHHIHYQNYATSVHWNFIKSNKSFSIYELAYSIRKKLLNIFIDNGLKNNELGVASALILGIRDQLDRETLTAYANTGATHVLAVSGLHVGIIYIILAKLLFFFNKIKRGKLYKSIILISILWFYALITGLSPSVLRAATMFSFIIIADLTKRNTNIYNTLAASAFVLLAINPYLIMEVGFQLSYLAVIGIVYIQPKLYEKWKTENVVLDNIWQLTTVSIAAQIATFPITLFYFHQFPNYFLISNLVVIPLASVIVYTGLLIFITSFIPFISQLLTYILSFIIGFMNNIIETLSYLPYAITKGIFIDLPEVILLYLFLILILYFFNKKNNNLIIPILSICVIFISYTTYQKAKKLTQKEIVFYNIPKVSAIDFFDGISTNVLTDDSLSNQQKIFHINNYRTKMGITNESNTLNKLKHYNFIQFYDKKLLILNSINDINFLSEKINIDYLIISSFSKIEKEKIDTYLSYKNVVIDSSVPNRILADYQIDFPNAISINENGMYKIRL